MIRRMPTHKEDALFLRQWKRLNPDQQRQFLAALVIFKQGLRDRRFAQSLRVKDYHSIEGAYEMTWASDGRAIFRYGDEIHPGEPHIIWLRIGTHDIFD